MQKLFTGPISLTTKKDGYVRIAELEKEGAIFVDHSHLHTALQGDIVEVELLGKHKNQKGEDELYGSITQIIERGKKGYAGILEQENGIYFLVPDDRKMYTDIIIPETSLKDAKIGMKVVVALTSWTDAKKSPVGEVTAVLGKPGDNDAEMLAYALERGFSDIHDDAVVAEANEIKKRGIKDEDKENRRDFRNVPTFTIDPADAKDFDDAISFQKLENGHY
jgi:ribonuclease R